MSSARVNVIPRGPIMNERLRRLRFQVWRPLTWRRSNMILASYVMGLFGLFIIEFSLWNNFGNYIWYVSIGFTILDMVVGDIVSNQLKEVSIPSGGGHDQCWSTRLLEPCHVSRLLFDLLSRMLTFRMSKAFLECEIAGAAGSACWNWPWHGDGYHWNGIQRLHGFPLVLLRRPWADNAFPGEYRPSRR